MTDQAKEAAVKCEHDNVSWENTPNGKRVHCNDCGKVTEEPEPASKKKYPPKA